MSYHPLPQNGQPRPRLIHDVCELPCPDLDLLLEQFIAGKQLKLMLSCLTTVVALAADGRLRKVDGRGLFLFHGPPGTGKSSLARVLPQLWAKTTGGRGKLARVNVHAIASREHGQSQQHVADLFTELRRLEPTEPVFSVIDELETIATNRDEISGKTSPIDARNSVNSLLDQLDRKPPNCFILATTNVPQLLDGAVRSRFDFVFAVPLPPPPVRLQALLAAIKTINPRSPMLQPLAKSTVEQLADLTEGCSFREIKPILVWCMALHRGDASFLPGQVIATVKYLDKLDFWKKGANS